MTNDGFPPSGGSAMDAAEAIAALEHELSVLWRRARASARKVAVEVHPDLDSGAYGLLVLLQQEGALRLTDLAARVGVGKPSVSRQVAMLQELGLVRKQSDPADGRAQTISLTPQGKASLAQAQQARKEHFRQVWAQWDPEDLSTLGGLLHKLNAAPGPG